MKMMIRTANPDTDYVRIAELLQTFESQPTTPEAIREWDELTRRKGILQRSVAVDENDQILGYGMVSQNNWKPGGEFFLWLITDAAYRKQGIGTRLYDDALAFAQENDAATLTSEILENDADSQRFSEKRGFNVRRHVFTSVINLRGNAFDASPFSGVIEAVEASGIRLFSLADAGNTEEALYKLWEVNYHTYMDDPASDGTYPGFEEFQQITSGGKWFRPEGQILAAEGDKYVGLGAVGLYTETNSAYNLMTGVMPDYRGRKIALALKLLTIRVAQRWGVDYIRTNNDSQNAPMLAINRKLGYVSEPGSYRLIKTINQ